MRCGGPAVRATALKAIEPDKQLRNATADATTQCSAHRLTLSLYSENRCARGSNSSQPSTATVNLLAAIHRLIFIVHTRSHELTQALNLAAACQGACTTQRNRAT